jgi:hypothetical protein
VPIAFSGATPPPQVMVTTALQVLTLLLASETVKTTVFAPAFAQVKVLGAKLRLGGEVQASLLTLFTAPGNTVTVPPGATVALAGLHLAIGLVKSFTVTVPVQVLDKPATLVTVNVTTLAPMLLQLKVVLLKAKVSPLALHRSVLALLIPAAETEPFPALLSTTMAFLHLATGGWV